MFPLHSQLESQHSNQTSMTPLETTRHRRQTRSLLVPKLELGNQRRARELSSAHLVGICGSGMKALAEMLCGLGWRVTGSDLQHHSPTARAMQQRGLRIHQGHHDHYLPKDTGVLVYSPAVSPSNPELRRAAQLHIPALSYSQMLGRLMRDRIGISIAGTHGKSTTSAMTATILSDAGLAPSAVVGAELCGRGVSGWAGDGELFVVESCEYRRSFLDLHPKFAVISGVEPDHFDCYHNFEETKSAFADFAAQVAGDGVLLVRGDCPASVAVAKSASAEVFTFSQEPGSDWWMTDLRRTSTGTRFRVFLGGWFFAEISLRIPGRHNQMNALAAAALSHLAGASAADIRESLRDFRGVRRRFEQVGSWRGVTLIDDYAHHPTAVAATLETAREQFDKRRIWCAFQPHQVSRTQALMDDFATCFWRADEILIAPIFAAREELDEEPETTARELTARISGGDSRARFCPSLDQMIATLEDEVRPGDVLITMGAGDIDRVPHEFTRRLQRNHPPR